MKKQYLDLNKAARNRKRLKFYNYGPARRAWSQEDLQRFLDLNGKDTKGKYNLQDHAIACLLKCTLASVQYLRRKANLIAKNPGLVGNVSELELMTFSEERLLKHVQIGAML